MGLPSGYRQVAYIAGFGTQYIDTGFIPNENSRLNIKFQTATSKCVIAGCDKGYKVSSFMLAVTIASFNTGAGAISVADGAIHETSFYSGSVEVDGEKKSDPGSGAFTTDLSVYLFCNNRSGSTEEFMSGNIYACTLYNGTTLVRNFVPCVNSSGEAGLWDTVGSKFYTNAGTDSFTAGPYTSIKTGDILNFAYTGAVQSMELPKGVYKFECWGAQGGYRSNSSYGGLGGYSVGTLTLTDKKMVYIYAGGSGNTGGTSGGFNGGGKRDSYNGGGGASDIRIGQDSLYARIIVAGGGGSCGASSKKGMYGGGETGGSTTENYGSGGYGGTQTGVSNSSWQTTTQSTSTSSQSGAYAGFGFGGNGITRSSGYGGAGGGGWYGGSGAYPDGSGDDDRGGGGGSGYVYTSSTASNYPSGCLLTTDMYLSNAQTIAGNASMPSTSGSTETGHSGDGYVRITAIKVQSLNMPVNINGTWKDASEIYVNIGGLWKAAESAFVNIGGTWKELS